MNIKGLSKEQRINMLYSIYVAHPDAEKILEKIERCHNSRKYSSEPRSMALTGTTGSGKTTLIDQYIKRHPPSETEKTTSVPIFKSIIQPNTNIRDFILSVLKSLAASVSDVREDDVNDQILRGNSTAIRKRLYKYIAEADVKIIILDEFQHLISDKNKKVLNDVANTIKTLINETKVPVILVGTTKANAVLTENPEMSRRISEKIKIEPFFIYSQDNSNTFRKFLAEVDKLLPFEKVSMLADKDMSLRFYAASNGYIDDIMRVITDAGYNAILEGTDQITTEHLADAFEQNAGENQYADGNPFAAPIHEIKKWRCIQDEIHGRAYSGAINRNTVPSINDIF